MEEARSTRLRNAVSTMLADDDLSALERLARQKRSSLAQVIREFIVAGIEREQRLAATERVAV